MSYSHRAPAPLPREEEQTSALHWQAFRTVRDLRSELGLRPGHLATLQAMLSFLKPGEGHVIFASNAVICLRAGGIDERTFRRHAQALTKAGLVERQDSPNRKRYRITGADGEQLGFGFSIAPMLARLQQFMELARQVAQEAQQKKFLRKSILCALARLDELSAPEASQPMRKILRRQLSLPQYEALWAEVEAMLPVAPPSEAAGLTANDGQNDRHHSKSEKIQTIDSTSRELPDLRSLLSVTREAQSFANEPIRSWEGVERLAATLAPMIGLSGSTYAAARARHGHLSVASTVLLLLEMPRLRKPGAYFNALMLGKRSDGFDPRRLVDRIAARRDQGIYA